MQRQVATTRFERSSTYQVIDHENRLQLLEEAVFKQPKGLAATEPQRFLIFYHSGYLKAIEEMNIQQNQKHLRIGVLLNVHEDNVKKFYNDLKKKDSKYKTLANYAFLVNFFNKVGDSKKADEMQRILESIEKKKG